MKTGSLLFYIMIKVSNLFASKYNKDTHNPLEVNFSILKEILNSNKDTLYGRKFKFSSIQSIDDYKKHVPLTNYDDYRMYIERLIEGEEKVLVSEKIDSFSYSSGTTGNKKLIPVTKKSRKVASSHIALLTQNILYKHFKKQWFYGRGLNLMDIRISETTKSGIPIGAASAGGMRSMKKMIPHIWTSPVEILNPDGEIDSLYFHLLFALTERNLMYINATFFSSILNLFVYLEKNWVSLVEDIKNGTINENVKITSNIREALLKKLSPNPQRSIELGIEFEKGFCNIINRIWPNLLYICSVAGAGFSIYHEKSKKYIGDTPVYSAVYASSEGIFGISPYVNKPTYSITPRGGFYEFIPIENSHESSPTTLCINDLEEGKDYEIVITNFSGFYRYRIGDVIRVAGFYNKCPEVEFLYRLNSQLNIAGEKTTENHMINAFKNTSSKTGIKISDYTVHPYTEELPGKYIVFVELEGYEDKDTSCISKNNKIAYSHHTLPQVEKTLEEEMCNANFYYELKRNTGHLLPLQLKYVQPGTFSLLQNLNTNNSGSQNQLKTPRMVKEGKLLQFLNDRLLDESHKILT